MKKQIWEIGSRYVRPNNKILKAGVSKENIAEAITNGGNIILSEDATIGGLVKVEKETIIDLGGNTLTFEAQKGYPGIKNTSTLIITNGKIISNQVGILNNGELIIDCEVESVENAINNVFDGKVIIEGGYYKNTSKDKALIVSNSFGKGNPEIIINGGSFESYFTNVSFNNDSVGKVNAGIFKCTGPWHNIYVGGESGNCDVTYSELDCNFESKGVRIQVNNWNKNTNINIVNGIEYNSTEAILE